MIAFSLVLIAFAVLASLGSWMLFSTLWSGDERDARWIGGLAIGMLLLLGAVGLLSSQLPELGEQFRALLGPAQPVAEGEYRPWVPPADFPEFEAGTAERPVESSRLATDQDGVEQPYRREPRSGTSGPEQLPTGTPLLAGASAASASARVDAPSDAPDQSGGTIFRDSWPATRCVATFADVGGWYVSNRCKRPIAIMFATNGVNGWQYAGEGIVLLGLTDSADTGLDTTGSSAYLACFITSPSTLEFLNLSQLSRLDVRSDTLDLFTSFDDCLSVVRSASRFGSDQRRSPIELFR